VSISLLTSAAADAQRAFTSQKIGLLGAPVNAPVKAYKPLPGHPCGHSRNPGVDPVLVRPCAASPQLTIPARAAALAVEDDERAPLSPWHGPRRSRTRHTIRSVICQVRSQAVADIIRGDLHLRAGEHWVVRPPGETPPGDRAQHADQHELVHLLPLPADRRRVHRFARRVVTSYE
jgi:hypothetical protein